MSKAYDTINGHLNDAARLTKAHRSAMVAYRTHYPEDAGACDPIIAELTNRINKINHWSELLRALSDEEMDWEYEDRLLPELKRSTALVERLSKRMPASSGSARPRRSAPWETLPSRPESPEPGAARERHPDGTPAWRPAPGRDDSLMPSPGAMLLILAFVFIMFISFTVHPIIGAMLLPLLFGISVFWWLAEFVKRF